MFPGKSELRAGAIALLMATLVLGAACRSKDESTSKNVAPSAAAGSTTAGQKSVNPNEALRASDVGITETEIKIGQHTGHTGAYASYWPISQSLEAYFKYINEEKGGVNGRKINFIIKDDQTTPAVAKTVVQELIDNDKVFAFVGNLGTANHSAVADLINQKKIPDLFVFTGAGKWNDPQNLPYTFGWTFSYPNESKVLAAYAKQNFGGKRVGVLYQNDDFGKDYLTNFGGEAKSGQNALQIVSEQSFEASTSDIASQMQALKNSGAEVLFLASTPKHTILAYKYMRESGWKPQVIMSSVSADPSVIEGGGADITEGTVTAAYLPDISDDTNAAVAEHKKLLAKYAPGVTPSNFTISGWAMGQITVDVLTRAGRNPTREDVVKATESIKDFKGLAYGDYNTNQYDHHPLHCEKAEKVQGGKLVQFGELICAALKTK